MTSSTDTLRSAAAAEPENPDRRMELGLALAAEGNLRGAAAEFEEAIRLDPERAVAHYNLGVVYGRFLLDDLSVDEYFEDHTDEEAIFEKASSHYKEAIRLQPGMTAALNNLARIHAAMGMGPEARGFFEQSLAINPEQPEVTDDLAGLDADEAPGEEAWDVDEEDMDEEEEEDEEDGGEGDDEDEEENQD